MRVVGDRRVHLTVDNVGENDEDHDGDENKPKDNHLGQENASLSDAESVDFAMGMP